MKTIIIEIFLVAILFMFATIGFCALVSYLFNVAKGPYKCKEIGNSVLVGDQWSGPIYSNGN